MNFKITNSLIYVSNGELILDGKLILTNKNPEEIYQFLLTPKNYRTDFKKINLDYTYNFDQKVMKLRNIKIDDKFNEILNLNLKSLIFKNNKLQNKVYLKGLLNKAIKSYAG
jgi:outer membrane lipoprotein-sorting protein